MKKLTIVWTITLVLIVGGLTVFGLNMKKNNIGEISEESLVTQVKKYLGLYTAQHPTNGGEKKFTADQLKEDGYDPELSDECSGYVIVKAESMGYSYKAYVKCPDYVTKGYSNE